MKRAFVLILALLWASTVGAQIPATLPVTLQTAATATGNGTAVTMQGYVAATFQTTISATATVVYEGSINDGATYSTLTCYDLAGATLTSSTATQLVRCNTTGIQMIRARVSAYTSGTITVTAIFIAAGEASTPAGSSGGAGNVNLTGINGNAPLTAQNGQIKTAVCDPTTVTQCAGVDSSGRLTALVSDGTGALNVIVDSGTLTAVTTVGTITNPVTVTDGAGALNVIVDSGVITTVSTVTAVTTVGTITNPVTVTDGAGALNVIVDSGTTAVTQATAANLNATVIGAGSAGTANAGVVTVQGIASMTPVSANITQILSAAVSQTNPLPVVFPGTLVSGAVTSAMAATTSTSVVSGTGSNYLYITNCVVSNASTTVSTDILLQDGSGGTTLYVIPAPAAAVATTGGGGASVSFPVPLKVPTSGNALFAANVTTGSSTKISCSGFRSTVSY